MPQCATPLGLAQQQQQPPLKKLQFPRPSFGHFHFMAQHRGSTFSFLLSHPSLLPLPSWHHPVLLFIKSFLANNNGHIF